jgi:hypothetical protein
VPWRPPIWAITLALCAAAADSGLAATARPFTWRADFTTGIGLAVVVLIGLANIRGLVIVRLRNRQEEAAAGGPLTTPPCRRPALAWGTLATAVVIFELINFFVPPRSGHPTISSLLDVLTGHEVLRGALFAAWLGTGWWLWGKS